MLKIRNQRSSVSIRVKSVFFKLHKSGPVRIRQKREIDHLIIDNEINGMNYFPYNGIEVTEDTLDYDGIKRVGIGRDFLGEKNTMENIDAPSNPKLFNREMVETWARRGSKDLTTVAHDRVVEILKNEPQRTPLSSSQRADMDRIIKASDVTCPRL